MAKNLQAVCLNQTIHFKLNEEISRNMALEKVKDECEVFKNHLKNRNLKYKIIDEKTKDDGSIIIMVKKQLSNYSVGNYLD
jgi:hypothetical protein